MLLHLQLRKKSDKPRKYLLSASIILCDNEHHGLFFHDA